MSETMFFDTINEEDLPLLREYRNDWAIRRWCRQVGLISELKQIEWWSGLSEDDSKIMFSIKEENINDGKIPVGVCGLTSIDLINKRAEFSLYIAPKHQKKGLARRALKMLFQFGFDELALNLIWGETFDGNHAAKLFERLGMIKEGTRRDFYFKEGKFIDCHLYSIKKDELKVSELKIEK